MYFPDHVPWDVTSRATRVKRTRVRDDGLIAESDTALDKFFESCKFGLIDKPAVILDIHGVILAWYLPDIISQSRIVSRLDTNDTLLLFINI